MLARPTMAWRPSAGMWRYSTSQNFHQKCAWWIVPTVVKSEWRWKRKVTEAPCVMTAGTRRMWPWCAGSWAVGQPSTHLQARCICQWQRRSLVQWDKRSTGWMWAASALWLRARWGCRCSVQSMDDNISKQKLSRGNFCKCTLLFSFCRGRINWSCPFVSGWP